MNSTVTQNKRDILAWISTEVDTTATWVHGKLHRARYRRTISLWNRRTRTARCSGNFYSLSPYNKSLRFSVLVQTYPGTHPASCTMGYFFFPGVKAAGDWRWLPAPSRAEVKVKKHTAISLLPLWAYMTCSVVNLTSAFTFNLNEDSQTAKCK
jgi:hypothetical protein